MRFAIGEKVVCIFTREDWASGTPSHILERALELPKKGGLYHVYGYAAAWPAFMKLNEIAQPLDPALHSWFHERGFAPIIERKTSIECFTRLLTPTPRRIETVR